MDTIAQSLKLALDLIAQFDARLLAIVGLSLRVSASACVIAALLGLLAGAFLAAVKFPGRRVAVWFVNTMLALPPAGCCEIKADGDGTPTTLTGTRY